MKTSRNNLIHNMNLKISRTKLNKIPFDHLVIDNFLPQSLAFSLSSEFPKYDSSKLHKYKNALEDKKATDNWLEFNKFTYLYFSIICSQEINLALSKKFKIDLIPDYGLHGGGQHIHSKKGNLNPHLDYAIHPKLTYERRINLIYYLTDNYIPSDGGYLGFWENTIDNKPGNLIKEYAPKFNRCVIFNTSQNSWHGLSRIYNPKKNNFRKSLASYYLSKTRKNSRKHTRALFATRTDQNNNKEIQRLIKLRSSEKNSSKVYVKK